MRILLALDGSEPADRARDLVASLPWPTGSTVRAVAALEASPNLFGGSWIAVRPSDAAAYEEEACERLEAVLADAAGHLAAPGRTVETELLRGSPAMAIVEESRHWKPDLIVIGSRGPGALDSTLIGSVSGSVVDHARCPVLVARKASASSVLFAADGSAASRAAQDLLETWGIFRSMPVEVLGVVDLAAPWRTGIGPTMFDAAMEVYAELIADERRSHEEVVSTAARDLTTAGITADSVVREGSPRDEIVAEVRERGVDLVVMGSRGHAGISRLFIGSVAHHVLLHAPSSVLIVRERQGGPEGSPA